jgi:hypothetical protein
VKNGAKTEQNTYSDHSNTGLVFEWCISAGTGHPNTGRFETFGAWLIKRQPRD